MSNQLKIYAHPDLNCAVSGKPSEGDARPLLIDIASSMEVAAAMILGWVCRNGFTGAGDAPFTANTESLICNVWVFKAPSGERWYIAAHQHLDTPINQEVNS